MYFSVGLNKVLGLRDTPAVPCYVDHHLYFLSKILQEEKILQMEHF